MPVVDFDRYCALRDAPDLKEDFMLWCELRDEYKRWLEWNAALAVFKDRELDRPIAA
jgi:hypothetical protein